MAYPAGRARVDRPAAVRNAAAARQTQAQPDRHQGCWRRRAPWCPPTTPLGECPVRGSHIDALLLSHGAWYVALVLSPLLSPIAHDVALAQGASCSQRPRPPHTLSRSRSSRLLSRCSSRGYVFTWLSGSAQYMALALSPASRGASTRHTRSRCSRQGGSTARARARQDRVRKDREKCTDIQNFFSGYSVPGRATQN